MTYLGLGSVKKNGGLMVQGMSTIKTYDGLYLLLCKYLIAYWSKCFKMVNCGIFKKGSSPGR